MQPRTLEVGDVVQLSPQFANPHFRGALIIVTEPKSFGIQGFAHGLERGEAYVRVEWKDMEYIGRAAWLPQESPDAG